MNRRKKITKAEDLPKMVKDNFKNAADAAIEISKKWGKEAVSLILLEATFKQIRVAPMEGDLKTVSERYNDLIDQLIETAQEAAKSHQTDHVSFRWLYQAIAVIEQGFDEGVKKEISKNT